MLLKTLAENARRSIGDRASLGPQILNLEREDFHLSRIEDELSNIYIGMEQENRARAVKGLLNLIEEALGTLAEMGIQIDEE